VDADDSSVGMSGECRSVEYTPVKKVKADKKRPIALHGNPLSELRDVTCHMGSHSVT